MLRLSAEQIEKFISPKAIIAAVRKSLLRCQQGEYLVPKRLHLEKEGNTYLVMPALGPDYFCTKIVSVIPANVAVGRPLINGTLQLSAAATGQVLAEFDAPMITALRTGAVGAIGLDCIAPLDTETIGIIGCGLQGCWQTIFAGAVRNLKRVNCFARSIRQSEEHAVQKEIFIRKIRQYRPALEFHWYDTPEELVRQSPVIYGCTSSSTPIFANNPKLVKGKRFISIGSFRKDMQEFPAVVYQGANKLIIDSPAATLEVGDVINALSNNWLEENEILHLQDLINIKETTFQEEVVSFKSVGMAAFDLGLAAALYDKHLENSSQ